MYNIERRIETTVAIETRLNETKERMAKLRCDLNRSEVAQQMGPEAFAKLGQLFEKAEDLCEQTATTMFEINHALTMRKHPRSEFDDPPCPGPGYHAPGDCSACDAVYQARATRQARKE